MPAPSSDDYLRDVERRARCWRMALAIGGALLAVLIVAVSGYVLLNRVEVTDERALAAIRASGLRDATLGGADTAGCEEAESSRQFTAINTSGDTVKGTVCCGLTGVGKGCVIRWRR